MKRLAAIVTEYRYLSHAQIICDRILEGYFIDGRRHQPQIQIASMYVDQRPENDLSAGRAEQYDFSIHHTISAALRCGGNVIDVDGVLIIAEHGEYPTNPLGQTLYPRHDFYRQVVQVFRQDGRTTPVFVDKHLSYEFEKAEWMVLESRRGRFPLLAGSSIPLAWRLPPLELPIGCRVDDALMTGYSAIDKYDFHALEALQAMVERRGPGETGVRAVRYYAGDDVWQAGEDGVWSTDLLRAAISRSDKPQGHGADESRPEDVVGLGYVQSLAESPGAYVLEYVDGLRATMLMLNGVVPEFLFAAFVDGSPDPVSTQFMEAESPNVVHFDALVSKIEEMIVTGEAPYPVERTLLTSGILEACLRARHEGVERVKTPELVRVRYRPSEESHFLRR